MSVLLRRLADEDLDVAAAALSTKAVLQLPAAALFEAVAQTSSRAWEALLRKDEGISGGKAQAVVKNVSRCRTPLGTRIHAVSDIHFCGPLHLHSMNQIHCMGTLVVCAARIQMDCLCMQALSLLTGPFHEANPSFRGETAHLLLGYILVMPSLRKLGVSVLRAAGSLEHPLLTGEPAGWLTPHALQLLLIQAMTAVTQKPLGSADRPGGTAGLTEIASELQESTAKSTADLAGKKPSKAQLIGNCNRKIISTLAASVRHDSEALAVVENAAKGQGRTMHAATVILAYAAASMDVPHQGMSLPAQFLKQALSCLSSHGLHGVRAVCMLICSD